MTVHTKYNIRTNNKKNTHRYKWLRRYDRIHNKKRKKNQREIFWNEVLIEKKEANHHRFRRQAAMSLFSNFFATISIRFGERNSVGVKTVQQIRDAWLARNPSELRSPPAYVSFLKIHCFFSQFEKKFVFFMCCINSWCNLNKCCWWEKLNFSKTISRHTKTFKRESRKNNV